MAQFKEGDRVRVKHAAESTSPPEYILGKAATVEVVLDAEAGAEDAPQRYRVRVDRFPDDVYQEGMRRHHNLPEDWLEFSQE